MDDFNQQEDTLLDSALNKLAISPLPPDFTHQVMAAVHLANTRSTQNNAAVPVRFRLQFLDVALALFWSLALAVVWIFVLWLTGILPVNWLPQAQSNFSLLDQLSPANPTLLLTGIILLLLEMSLLGLIGLNLLGERP